MLCERSCPDEAIKIESEKRVDGPGRVLIKFTIDLGRCMYCGLCVEQCSTDGLHHTGEFENNSTAREAMMLVLYEAEPGSVAAPPLEESTPEELTGGYRRVRRCSARAGRGGLVTQAVLFYFYAIIAVGGAIALVTAKNLIHGAVGLLATLVAIGALFLLLGSEFLAAMQLFVYGGAITILIMFALMLAGPRVNREERPTRVVYGVAGVVCALFFVGVSLVLLRTGWHVAAPVVHTTESIAEILFSRYVLPFEIAGLSLTIALIGAIVIAREDDVRADANEDAETPAALSGDEAGLG